MTQLIEILRSRKAFDIVEYLIENQGKTMNQSEISRNTRISRNTVSKWLNFFVQKGLVKEKVIGRMKCYNIVHDNSVVKQIKILTNVIKLFDVFKELKEKNLEVYLYGSCARGEDDPKSDVDILIIGKLNRKKLVKLIEKAKKSVKKEVKPLVLTPLEYSTLAREDKTFYETIEKEKIRLI